MRTIFLVEEGREDPNPNTTLSWAIIGQPAKRRWWSNIECWLVGSFASLRGSGPVLLRSLIFLCFFRAGGGGPDPLSPLWIRSCILVRLELNQ